MKDVIIKKRTRLNTMQLFTKDTLNKIKYLYMRNWSIILYMLRKNIIDEKKHPHKLKFRVCEWGITENDCDHLNRFFSLYCIQIKGGNSIQRAHPVLGIVIMAFTIVNVSCKRYRERWTTFCYIYSYIES